MFENKAQFEKACQSFASQLSSSIVHIEPEMVEWDEDGYVFWNFTFKVKFKLSDKYVNLELYEKGEADIHLSDEFYKDATRLGKQFFGSSPSWNNVRTTGWFIGHK